MASVESHGGPLDSHLLLHCFLYLMLMMLMLMVMPRENGIRYHLFKGDR